MLNVLVALLPVLAFLGVLLLLDSFKLVSVRSVLQAIAAGSVVALLCAALHAWLLDASALSPGALSRYVAPFSEEVLKSLYVAYLIQRRRVGFLVDAAIQGFAVGAGFALVENAEYLRAFADPRVFLWIVRGLGTAVLHGATTAIFAILSKGFADRHPERPLAVFLPGGAAAISTHSLFNHFILPPLLATALLLAVLPLAVVAVFQRSERATRRWLGLGLDAEVDLLSSILAGDILQTRVGAYLLSLQSKFPGAVLADMLCLLRIQLELSIRAKGLLLAREAGLALVVGEDVRANFQELRYLERAIGRTGLLAMKPMLRRSSRDLWQLYMLEQAGLRLPFASEARKKS